MAKNIYDKLNTGSSLFVGLRYDANSVVSNHIELWQSLQPVSTEKYSILKVQYEYNQAWTVLFFTNEQDMRDFETWWEIYTKRFHNDDYLTKSIPEPHDGQFISGYPISHRRRSDRSRRNDMFNMEWQWIYKNTEHKVWWTSNFWIFENEAEMIMFKLSGDTTSDSQDDDNLPF